MSPSLAIIDVVGPIVHADAAPDSWAVSGPGLIAAMLRAAVDPRVRAVAVRIDSPGGDSSLLDDLYAAARELAAAKPAAALVAPAATSLAYALAAGLGWVEALPLSLVGSIGSIVVVEDTSGMAGSAGVKVHALTSGATHKAAGVRGVPITDEQLAAIGEVNEEASQAIVGVVAAARGIDPRAIESWRGRVYTGRQGLALGLVDRVTTEADFWRRAAAGAAAR